MRVILLASAALLIGATIPAWAEEPSTEESSVVTAPEDQKTAPLPRSLVYGGYTLGGWFMSKMGMLHQVTIGYWYRFDSFTFGTRLALGLDHIDDHGLVHDLFTYAIRFSPMVRIDLPHVDVMFGPGLGVAILNQQVAGEEGVRQTGRFDGSLALGLDLHLHEHFTVMTLMELSVYAFILNDDVAVELAPEATVAIGWRF